MTQDGTMPKDETNGAKRRVLFFYPPSFYLVTGYKIKSMAHRFVGSAGKLLSSSLDPERFEVDLYDFDAKLSAHAPKIEEIIDEIPELYYEKPFRQFLRGERSNPVLDGLLDLLCRDLAGYDYLLCANQRNPLYEIPNFAGNNLTLLIMQRLARANPGAEKIYGGKRSHYIDFSELEREGVDISELVDAIIYGQIPFQSINRLLTHREVAVSGFYDRKGTYKAVHLPVPPPQPPLDYSLPRDVLRNRQDLRYTYRRIFDDLHLDLPEGADGSKYIQQAGMHYIGGCISNCAFCSTGVAPVKFGTLEHIQETIKIYVNELGYNAFFFKNATVNSNHRMLENLCNWIVRENLKFQWSDSCRLSRNGPDFYPMLYEAGARMLCYGVDSGSDRILNYVKKGSTAEEMSRQLENAHKAGIWNLVNFIGGMPYETLDDVDETISFLMKHLPFINIFKFNAFHMEQVSPFALKPEAFKLRLLDSVETRNLENVVYDELRFEEIEGRSWEQILEFRKQMRVKIRECSAVRGRKFMTHIGQPLLFSLYDLLGSKDKVEEWLFRNYRIGRRRYYEKYAEHPKIEPWDSELTLYPNFEGADSDRFIFKGNVLSAGHPKLGDVV